MNTCQIERAESCNETLAFLPHKHLNINLSVGGTKILTALINNKKEFLFEPHAYKWREAFEKLRFRTNEESREWFITQMMNEILKAEKYAKERLEEAIIEGVGLSWAGPITRDGKLLGPNIEGFRFDQLTNEELGSGGVPLEAILKERFQKLGKKWSLTIMNDADAAARVAFSDSKDPSGLLLILGTGVGSGLLVNGACYFGPPDYKARMGEIGHHIVYDEKTGRYSYYGKESKGLILNVRSASTLNKRLSGPALARRFLQQLKENFRGDLPQICNYLAAIDQASLLGYYKGAELVLKDEEVILRFITDRAKEGDAHALKFIVAIGLELGQAIGSFFSPFKNEPFTRQIKLAGSVGQFFGLGVQDEKELDLFIEAIKRGLSDS